MDIRTGMDVDKLDVTVIGGHAGTTIMPLLSQVRLDDSAEKHSDTTEGLRLDQEPENDRSVARAVFNFSRIRISLVPSLAPYFRENCLIPFAVIERAVD